MSKLTLTFSLLVDMALLLMVALPQSALAEMTMRLDSLPVLEVSDDSGVVDGVRIDTDYMFEPVDPESFAWQELLTGEGIADIDLEKLARSNLWLADEAKFFVFRLHWRGDQSKSFVLEHTFSYTDYMSVIHLRPGSERPIVLESGDKVPHERRSFDYRNPSFAVHLAPGVNEFMVRMETKGPVHFSLRLWDTRSFESMIRVEYAAIGVLFGFALVMAAYNLLLAIRFKNPSYYLYVFYILAFLNVQFIFTGLATEFLPFNAVTVWYTNEGLVVLGEVTALFGTLFALGFLNIRSKTPLLYRGVQVFFFLSFCNIILAQLIYNYSVIGILFSNGLVSFLLLSAGFVGACRRFRPAYFYTAAWGCIILGSLFTMAQIYGLLPENYFTKWSQFGGGALEMVLLSLALGDKMQLLQERAHDQISYLNKNLEGLVDAKTKQIRSLLDYIPQGVLSISADGKVSEDYSAHLEQILESSQIGGQDFYEMILAKTDLQSDSKDQVWQTILACLGESEFNFEANADKLPHELVYNSSTGDKVLKVTWNIQLDDDEMIERFLVTLLDISAEKRLEQEAEVQRRELLKIQELLAINPNKIAQFFSTSLPLLLENKNLIDEMAPNSDLSMVKSLFVNAHTVKGAARTLHLQDLTSVIHEAESYYSQILKEKNPIDIKILQQDIMNVLNAFHSYIDINRNKLNRDDDFQKVAIQREFIEHHYQILRDIVDGQDVKIEHIIASLKQQSSSLTKMIFEQLPSIFDGYFEKVEKIASDMGKRAPDFNVDIDEISISPDRRVVLDNCMIHILRNIVDHGLEQTAERRAAGKKESGTITVKASEHHGILSLEISDDGRGLAIAELRKRGLAQGLIREDASQLAVANLIFESGVTTAKSLSEISGRGVGMNAVKTFLDRVGGSIQVVLGKPTSPSGEYYHFSFIIRMPSHSELSSGAA